MKVLLECSPYSLSLHFIDQTSVAIEGTLPQGASKFRFSGVSPNSAVTYIKSGNGGEYLLAL